jgi:CRP-like cAMP-binding protein
LLREGQVALELASGEGTVITFQTIGAGEILGASWLVPPFRWTFDARALERTRAIALDAVCVRTKCEENPELGWDLMKRFVPVLVERMQAARLQMLDVYGRKS